MALSVYLTSPAVESTQHSSQQEFRYCARSYRRVLRELAKLLSCLMRRSIPSAHLTCCICGMVFHLLLALYVMLSCAQPIMYFRIARSHFKMDAILEARFCAHQH